LGRARSRAVASAPPNKPLKLPAAGFSHADDFGTENGERENGEVVSERRKEKRREKGEKGTLFH
jgi:hypothetical protein